MCLNEQGHKMLACTVGDLGAGREYRTPEGDTMLVTSRPREDGMTTVVNLRTGEILRVPSTTNLGHDKRDRLYASRSLNPAPTLTVGNEDRA